MTEKSPPNAFRLGRVLLPTPLPPPQKLTFVWLLCIDKPAATGHPRPVIRHSSIFRCEPLGRPNQGIPPQRARARVPGANGGSDGLAAATARADAIVVETIDAEVYTAPA